MPHLHHFLNTDPQVEGDLLGFCIMLASIAHADQVDKAGEPYILHCLEVMNGLSLPVQGYADDIVKCIAILHDTVEDTAITLSALETMGIPTTILFPLGLLTHARGMAYETYIDVISVSAVATEIKRSDLRHNSDIMRLKGVTEKDTKRMVKYHKAYTYLGGDKSVYQSN